MRIDSRQSRLERLAGMHRLIIFLGLFPTAADIVISHMTMGCRHSKPSSEARSIHEEHPIKIGELSNLHPLISSISTSSTDTNATDAFCWICLDEGPDEEDQPLMSGCCSCRGSSGHCHLSCVAKHAESITRGAVERGPVNLHNTWLKCNNCKQQWTGHHLTIMGSKCANFIIQTYPCHTELNIRALGIKRQGVILSQVSTLEEQQDAAKNVILAIDKLPLKISTYSKPILLEKYDAYYTLGRIALKRKDPNGAIVHFRTCQHLLRQHLLQADVGARSKGDNNIDLMKLEMQIAEANSLLPNADKDSCNKTIQTLQRAVFEHTKRIFGESSQHAIAEGWNLAVVLFELEEFADARKVLMDLGHVSRRVHGPDHSLTRGIDRFLKRVCKSQENAAAAESQVDIA